jgi:hypothetical protein
VRANLGRLTQQCEPDLQTFHGHPVNVRRDANVHWRHLHPFAPTDRRELWLHAPDGTKRKFTVHSREMPARARGEPDHHRAPSPARAGPGQLDDDRRRQLRAQRGAWVGAGGDALRLAAGSSA